MVNVSKTYFLQRFSSEILWRPFCAEVKRFRWVGLPIRQTQYVRLKAQPFIVEISRNPKKSRLPSPFHFLDLFRLARVKWPPRVNMKFLGEKYFVFLLVSGNGDARGNKDINLFWNTDIFPFSSPKLWSISLCLERWRLLATANYRPASQPEVVLH